MEGDESARGFFIMYGESIKALQDELGAVVGPDLSRSVLFRFGFRCGRMSATEMGLVGQGKKALDFVGEAWIEIGLARPTSIKQDGNDIVVKLDQTLESSHNGTGCDFTRGFLGGMMSGITNIPYHCLEKQCASKGAKECVFVLTEKPGSGSGR
jgi:predicted hydrocarbon binding protein